MSIERNKSESNEVQSELKIEEPLNSNSNDSKLNLNENLLSKLNIFEQRIASNTCYTKKSGSVSQKNKDDANNKTSINKIIRSVTAMTNNPLDEEEEEKEEKKKIEFNKTVEEMAQYYINEREISSFYIKQFFETVLIHLLYFLFGPLILPLLFKIWSRDFMRNMGLYGKKVGYSHLIQIFYWISFILTVVFTVLINYSDVSSVWNLQKIFLSPSYIAQIFVLIRYMTVCVKYGFFPPEYYIRWREKRLTRTEVKSNFLLQGWIKPSLLVLDVYLKEIFQKFNIDFNEFNFRCAGVVPVEMINSLTLVDRLINEDVKRMRKSMCRRMNKEIKFINTIKDAYKLKHQQTSLELEMIPENVRKVKFNDKTFDLDSSLNERMDNSRTMSNSAKRFREFVVFKVLPMVREKINSIDSVETKIKITNENCYEFKGIYLLRVILKDVFTASIANYAFYHKIFVFTICLVPFIFTGLYYILFNKSNDGTSPKLNNSDSGEALFINFNFISIILLIFSACSLVPPVFLNTLNLIYGLVDIMRKRNLMIILTEMIDTNRRDRKYPLLNITHGNTMLNWYYLRNIVLSLGQRFGNRIKIQTSIFGGFVVIGVIISIFTLFGFFNQFLAMCLGVSFTFSILINFLIIFRMFLVGADFNYYEFIHQDLMMSHKLFLDELTINNKLMKKIKKAFPSTSISLFEDREGQNLESNRQTMESNIAKKSYYDTLMISNNLSSSLFAKILASDENFITNGESSLIKSSNILENLKEKIKIDGVVRPMKIFWVKADYIMVSRIVALMGTGLAMILGNSMKKIDFTTIVKT